MTTLRKPEILFWLEAAKNGNCNATASTGGPASPSRLVAGQTGRTPKYSSSNALQNGGRAAPDPATDRREGRGSAPGASACSASAAGAGPLYIGGAATPRSGRSRPLAR